MCVFTTVIEDSKDAQNHFRFLMLMVVSAAINIRSLIVVLDMAVPGAVVAGTGF